MSIEKKQDVLFFFRLRRLFMSCAIEKSNYYPFILSSFYERILRSFFFLDFRTSPKSHPLTPLFLSVTSNAFSNHGIDKFQQKSAYLSVKTLCLNISNSPTFPNIKPHSPSMKE